MASSDNLMAMEQPWTFRSTFSDAWISDIFTKENETLTKALHKSLSNTSSNHDVFSPEMFDSFLPKPDIPPVHTPSISGGSENDAAAAAPKPRRAGNVPPSGRVTKRKSRASKRATTTFITADPANFRQMVQQVTGVRFGGFDGQMPVAALMKPEPQRAYDRFYSGGGLATLDTSAFLLDGAASSLVAPPPSAVVGGGGGGGAAVAGLDFESFCSFPTLESWKV
ncbi:hypothetical protein BUALT_Bualt12G0042400 [Buddleja alternifolia]|uniref:VQ domain-containing protein n=1 Tax=Buddleja alternifolia TaxID=168488 RepID=A0AAV6WMF3_9LAMI|nr:hypothetical protein BUALT_Bualt12G0042400 [Buddleja alternifolia]